MRVVYSIIQLREQLLDFEPLTVRGVGCLCVAAESAGAGEAPEFEQLLAVGGEDV
jgi:hypothetical protein